MAVSRKPDPPKKAGHQKIRDPKAVLGMTARKPENDDRPLRHTKSQHKRKLRQKLEQAKL